MRRVTAYKSENGKVFKTAKEAAVEDVVDTLKEEAFEDVDHFTVGLIMDYYPKLSCYFEAAHAPEVK